MKIIVIDLVPIRVGEGGTGSGIWTYARELLLAMDKLEFQGFEISCLINEGQVPYLSSLQQIKLIPFPILGKNILKRLWWINIQLPLWCSKHQVDVLHKVATETPLLCSAKRVTTIHDFYYEYLLENHPAESIRLYERLENIYFSFVTQRCFRKSARLIAVSNATRKEAISRYPAAADRIHVIHHGAPCSREQMTDDRGRTKDEIKRSAVSSELFVEQTAFALHQTSNPKLPAKVFNILCVAKFMEHKGQHLLIEAFNALLDKHPDLVGKVCLNLRGFHNDQAYFDGIKKQLNQSSYSDQIKRIDFNPEDTISTIYADTDLVVLLSNYEGFGLPVLEAQGMEVPVLCSNLPVLKEVGGDGAVYVVRNNIEAIVDVFYRMITDDGFSQFLQERAAENINRFSWVKAAKETLSVYINC